MSKTEDINKKIMDLLQPMTVSELSYTLGRYCGPHNVLLCKRIHGFVIPKKMVEDLMASKSFEEIFLNDEQVNKA